jgi:exodeoxyribonuclease VII small subunit
MSSKKEDTTAQKDAVTLEEHFEAIEEILNRMESGEISLDESFALYKKGLSEIKAAHDALDLIAKEMLVLNGEGNLEAFE